MTSPYSSLGEITRAQSTEVSPLQQCEREDQQRNISLGGSTADLAFFTCRSCLQADWSLWAQSWPILDM